MCVDSSAVGLHARFSSFATRSRQTPCLLSANVTRQEAPVEVAADRVVDEALLRLGLIARLIPEGVGDVVGLAFRVRLPTRTLNNAVRPSPKYYVVVPSPLHCERVGFARGLHIERVTA